MLKYKHYIITRFNLRVEGWETTKKQTEVLTNEWLHKRMELFETYCLPSVNNQSNKNFTWLIFLDIETPEEFRKKIEKLVCNKSYIKLFYIDGSKELVPKSREFVLNDSNGFDFIITTRLDNDDVLHCDFVSTIQNAFKPFDQSIIDICDGYQLSVEQKKLDIREYHHPYNAFISLIEKRTDKINTIFSKTHYDWLDINTISIHSKKLWIEVVHDINKVNSTLTHCKILKSFDNESFSISNSKFFPRSYVYVIVYNYFIRFYFLLKYNFFQYLYKNKNVYSFLRKIKKHLNRN